MKRKHKRYKRNPDLMPFLLLGAAGVGGYFLYRHFSTSSAARSASAGRAYEQGYTEPESRAGGPFSALLAAGRKLAHFVTGKPAQPSRVILVNAQNFAQEILQSDKPVLLDVFASWCEPCKALSPALEQAAAAFGGEIKFAKLSLDDAPEVAKQLGAAKLPSIFAINKGATVAQQVGGVTPAVLNQFVATLLPAYQG